MYEYFVFLSQIVQAEGNLFPPRRHNSREENIRSWKGTGKVSPKALCAHATQEKRTTGLPRSMHLIRCVCCSASKLKTRYRNCIRPSKTDTTSWTNLIHRTNVIRFIRRAIVEFNYYHVLELNSSQLNWTIVRRINRALIGCRS